MLLVLLAQGTTTSLVQHSQLRAVYLLPHHLQWSMLLHHEATSIFSTAQDFQTFFLLSSPNLSPYHFLSLGLIFAVLKKGHQEPSPCKAYSHFSQVCCPLNSSSQCNCIRIIWAAFITPDVQIAFQIKNWVSPWVGPGSRTFLRLQVGPMCSLSRGWAPVPVSPADRHGHLLSRKGHCAEPSHSSLFPFCSAHCSDPNITHDSTMSASCFCRLCAKPERV